MTNLVIAVIWFLLSVVAGAVAASKGRSGGGVLHVVYVPLSPDWDPLGTNGESLGNRVVRAPDRLRETRTTTY